MTSGKCPHPWNKTKKGTFLKGHLSVNQGRGCFQKGRKLPEWQKQANSIIQKERYEIGKHSFKELNIIAFENRLKTKWYGLGKAEWKRRSKKILIRDVCHCKRCHRLVNKYSYNCHHIISYEISKDNSDENLRTLCRSCHIIEEWEFRKKSKNIQKI